MATTQSKNARCAAYVAGAASVAIFTSVPSGDSAPSTEVTGGGYARQTPSWSTPVNGVSSATITTPIPSGVQTQGYGYYGSGGAYFDGGALSAQQTFSANGSLTVTLTHTES